MCSVSVALVLIHGNLVPPCAWIFWVTNPSEGLLKEPQGYGFQGNLSWIINQQLFREAHIVEKLHQRANENCSWLYKNALLLWWKEELCLPLVFYRRHHHMLMAGSLDAVFALLFAKMYQFSSLASPVHTFEFSSAQCHPLSWELH